MVEGYHSNIKSTFEQARMHTRGSVMAAGARLPQNETVSWKLKGYGRTAKNTIRLYRQG
jgi:hypothetical protein